MSALGAACASSPAPVPVVSRDGDLSLLEGEWKGEYDAPSVGRHGSIVFKLAAGADTAYGSVLMVPRGWSQPLGPLGNPAFEAHDAPTPELLTISFVRLARGEVSGILDPYADPECDCAVYTTFTGQLVAPDVIEGTFVSRHGRTTTTYSGTWRVVRNGD